MKIQYLEEMEPLAYASDGAAGLDLRAATGTMDGDWYIPANGSAVIGCGVAIALPEQTFGRVVLRSGHGFNRDLTCHVGTVDQDYRGELKVKVFNHGKSAQVIKKHERFAQLIILPCLQVELEPVETLDDTARSDGGFGSTGQ